MKHFWDKYSPFVFALCVVGIIFSAFFIWKNKINTNSTQQLVPTSNLALKQQCSTDGVAYFNNTLLPQASPQTIAENNLKFSQQGNPQADLTESIMFGNPEYAYNSKLNTCLIYYIETSVSPAGTVTDFDIADIYANNIIDSYFEVNGKAGNQGSSFDDFDAYKQTLMGE